MAYGKITLTYFDYGGERSTITVPIAELDETTLVAAEANLDALVAAIEALQIDPGTPVQTRSYSVSDAKTDSSNVLNQREAKLLVVMETNASKAARRIEIPGFDLTKLSASNKGEVDILTGNGATLKSAIEAVYLDPTTGEGVTVKQMRHVGRNT